jgi:hypothetical protein
MQVGLQKHLLDYFLETISFSFANSVEIKVLNNYDIVSRMFLAIKTSSMNMLQK